MRHLEPLELEHRSLVMDWLRRYPPAVSDLTFTNLFVWRRSHPIRLLATDAALLVLAGTVEEGRLCVGGPLGEMAASDVITLMQDVAPAAPFLGFERVPEGALPQLRAAGLEPAADRENCDYVYRRQDLATLKGRRLHSKRNLVKRCLSRHQCSIEPMTPENMGEVVEMQDRWCLAHDWGADPGLCHECAAIRELLGHYEELGVTGAAVRVDGRVEAFTVGEQLAPGTAVIHFEKAMPAIEGLYQVVNQWFCRDYLADFEFVNREQDLGISGLRKAKQSYQPHHMVRKYKALLAEPLEQAAAGEGVMRCGRP